MLIPNVLRPVWFHKLSNVDRNELALLLLTVARANAQWSLRSRRGLPHNEDDIAQDVVNELFFNVFPYAVVPNWRRLVALMVRQRISRLAARADCRTILFSSLASPPNETTHDSPTIDDCVTCSRHLAPSTEFWSRRAITGFLTHDVLVPDVRTALLHIGYVTGSGPDLTGWFRSEFPHLRPWRVRAAQLRIRKLKDAFESLCARLVRDC